MLGGYPRDLANVPRWAILRTRPQSVAEHSYYVALYSKAICEYYDFGVATAVEVLTYAMTHDMDETISGDIPAPWRRHHGISDRPTPDALANLAVKRFGASEEPAPLTKAIVKVADVYEAAMFLAGEMSAGNRTVKIVFDELLEQVQAAVTDLGRLLKGDERWAAMTPILATTLRDNMMCETFRSTESY